MPGGSTELRPRFQCRMQIVKGLERGEQIADCRLQTCTHPPSGENSAHPQIADCRSQIADFRWKTQTALGNGSECRLQISESSRREGAQTASRLQNADFKIWARASLAKLIPECRFQIFQKSAWERSEYWCRQQNATGQIGDCKLLSPLLTCFGPSVHHTTPCLARGKCVNVHPTALAAGGP